MDRISEIIQDSPDVAHRPGAHGDRALAQQSCDAPGSGETLEMVEVQGPAGAAAERHNRVAARIEMPWPPSDLSGHNNGGWRGKSPVVKKHRGWACEAANAAKVVFPKDGDIRLTISFYPPDNRSDRVNFPNRMKPYFDGLADGWGVNDRRFLPEYRFYAPRKGYPAVVIEVRG